MDIRLHPVNLESKPRIVAAAGAVHRPRVYRYHLPRLWCVHLYNYSAQLRVDGVLLPIRPGHASILPPGVDLEYTLPGRSVHLYAHFTLPLAGAAARYSPLMAPAMIDLGRDFPDCYRDFERAIGLRPRWPTRTAIAVWDILWLLAEKQQPVLPQQHDQLSSSRHPAVEQTIQTIERQLHESLSGEALARDVGLSHHHLIRLFRAATGSTLQRYIRDRRIRRVEHLLLHTTLPIKAVAAEVGIPDLHQFNKAVRNALGRSPRQVRSSKPRL